MQKDQTSIIPKSLWCLVNNNLKAVEFLWWLQEKPFLLSLLMIPILEPLDSSAIDSLQAWDINNSFSIAWQVEKDLLILQSKHQEAVIFKDVSWNILKVWKCNMIIQLETLTEVLYSFYMDKIRLILQKKSFSIKWNSWLKMSHYWRKSSNIMNSKMIWNGSKLKSSKRQNKVREKQLCNISLQGKISVQFPKNVIIY